MWYRHEPGVHHGYLFVDDYLREFPVRPGPVPGVGHGAKLDECSNLNSLYSI